MNEEYEVVETDEPISPAPVAYIRTVRKSDLEDAPAELPDGLLYALHDESGRPLAVFKDRATAIVAARTNDFTPVSVH